MPPARFQSPRMRGMLQLFGLGGAFDFALSIPAHAGSVTSSTRALAAHLFFQSPRMRGMLQGAYATTTIDDVFQSPRMRGMLRLHSGGHGRGVGLSIPAHAGSVT